MSISSGAAAATIASSAANSGVERWLDRLSASHARAALVLILLSLAAFLPGFASIQPMDRDEPRFAQATKQMLESGDYVAIRFQDEARNKKPVGIYWLQAAAVGAAERLGVPQARTTIALYRLPSLVGAICAVLLTYWACLAFLKRREAFLAAALMAATILLGVEARLAKTDAVLTACCIAMMGGLARAYLARVRPGGAGRLDGAALALFWGGLALSILVKGPVGPMIVGLPMLALSIRERSARWLGVLRPWLGLAVVIVAVLPWFIAIAIETKGAFFAEAVGKDMLGKVGTGQERHWGPPGTYFIAFFGTAWPLAPFAAIAAQTLWRDRRDDAVAFGLAWIIPAWLVFEAIPTKLPHYVLPLYPAVALLTVRALVKGDLGPQRPFAVPAMLLLPLIPALALAGVPVAGYQLDHFIPWTGLPVLAVALGLCVVGWHSFRGADVWRSAVLAIVAAVVFVIGILGITQRDLRALKLSPRLAEAIAGAKCDRPEVVTAGYREPSLVFLIGTDLAMSDGRGAADFLKGGGCRVALVSNAEEPAFRARLVEIGATAPLLTRVSGFNINGGKRIEIGVFGGG